MEVHAVIKEWKWQQLKRIFFLCALFLYYFLGSSSIRIIYRNQLGQKVSGSLWNLITFQAFPLSLLNLITISIAYGFWSFCLLLIFYPSILKSRTENPFRKLKTVNNALPFFSATILSMSLWDNLASNRSATYGKIWILFIPYVCAIPVSIFYLSAIGKFKKALGSGRF